MTSAVLERDALMPRPPRGMGPGLLLALFVHALLVVALAVGVNWHASEPEGVAAELWAAVPQIAAPAPVEPTAPPTPTPAPPKPAPAPPQPVQRQEPVPDAQIAIERAKKEEIERHKKEEAIKLAEKQRLEQERLRKEQDAKRKEKQEEQRLAALREQNLKRIMGQAGANGGPQSTGTAARTAGPSASYAGRIKARIKPNIIFSDAVDGNPLATVKLTLSPDGTIVGREWVKRSGVASWDDAVMRAIDKTEVLPRDVDGRVPPSMEINFKPRD